ncbi:MAG: 50S ribosomal protein L9 [Candidatus Liptonbacteria bacterium]|nr:50S ribosomal protein L9 [Candidatus Liptonbacteria bacterium]
MRVILTEDVRNVGRKMDVKEVSDGYARNFLFPNNLAKPATPDALKNLEKQKADTEKTDAQLKKRLDEISATLKDKHLEFFVKTGERGEVFGSINKDAILKGLRDVGWLGKERAEIKMEHPLKKLGEHTIDIDLKKGVKARLKVVLLEQK